MKKLTAEKCRELIASMKAQQQHNDLTLLGDYHLQALEIALPILERQESGCEICGGNCQLEINHGEMGIELMICQKCAGFEQQESEGANNEQ